MPQLHSNFELNSKLPNFTRDSFKTFDEMNQVNPQYIDEGHISYCEEKKKHYIYNTVNNEATWTELDSNRITVVPEPKEANANLAKTLDPGSLVFVESTNKLYYRIAGEGPVKENSDGEVSALLLPIIHIEDLEKKYLSKSGATATYLSKSEAGKKYLTIGSAEEDYLSKSGAETTYLSKLEAGNKYLTIGSAETIYLSQSEAGSTYLTMGSAENDYLSKNEAKNDYLSKSEAGSTYLTMGSASADYLKKDHAHSTYLPRITAEATYLTMGSAAEEYLSKISAENDYLSKNEAGNKYLTIGSAENDYLSKNEAGLKYPTKNSVAEEYLSKTDATSTYLSKTDAQKKYAKKEEIVGLIDKYVPSSNVDNVEVWTDLTDDLRGKTGSEIRDEQLALNQVFDKILFKEVHQSATEPSVEINFKLNSWIPEAKWYNKNTVLVAAGVGPDSSYFNAKSVINSWIIETGEQFTKGIISNSGSKNNSKPICKIQNEDGEWENYVSDTSSIHIPTELTPGTYRYYYLAHFNKANPIKNNSGEIVRYWDESVAIESSNYVVLNVSKSVKYNTTNGLVENELVYWDDHMEDYFELPATCQTTQKFILPRKAKHIYIWNDICGYAEDLSFKETMTDSDYIYEYPHTKDGHRGAVKIKVEF